MTDDWRDRAACKGMDVSLFKPERGEWKALVMARTVCADCPVRVECLDDAIASNDMLGVRGGMSERQRRLYRRRLGGVAGRVGGRNRTGQYRPTVCGTDGGYYTHKRQGSTVCPACQDAHDLSPIGAAND